MKFTGENRRTRGKTCRSATLSTTNPTWTDTGSNSGLRGERPATNRLSHGTAQGGRLAHLYTTLLKMFVGVEVRRINITSPRSQDAKTL
jgi:hypothetical protein